MKQTYIRLLLYIWSFYCFFPFLFECFFGKSRIYYGQEESNVGFWVNTAFFFLVIFILKIKKTYKFVKIKPITKYAYIYYFISIVVLVVNFITAGGFIGVLTGENNGSLLNYISLFFNIQSAFFFLLFFQKDIRHIKLIIFSYLIFVTLTGSRSAAVNVLTVLFLYPFFENYTYVKSEFLKILKIVVIIAPFLFYGATLLREYDIDTNQLTKMIVGRISMNELSSIPLVALEDDSYDKQVFDDKYSLSNQVKLAINRATPFDLFKDDADPNQYYRSVFFGTQETFAFENYLSMNMTNPVYWIMSYGYFGGLLVSIILFVSLYRLLLWANKKNRILIQLIIICKVSSLWLFFDFAHLTIEIMLLVFSYLAFRFLTANINTVYLINNRS